MSIFDKSRNKVGQYERVSQNMSDQEKRTAEMKLLKPDVLKAYTGELPKHTTELDSRTVLIVFRNKDQMELVGHLFSIRESCMGKMYITNIELLEGIAKQVKSGELQIQNAQIVIGDSDGGSFGLDNIPEEELIPKIPIIVEIEPEVDSDLELVRLLENPKPFIRRILNTVSNPTSSNEIQIKKKITLFDRKVK